jgi:hypothetical protein
MVDCERDGNADLTGKAGELSPSGLAWLSNRSIVRFRTQADSTRWPAKFPKSHSNELEPLVYPVDPTIHHERNLFEFSINRAIARKSGKLAVPFFLMRRTARDVRVESLI